MSFPKSRLRELYESEVRPAIMRERELDNLMQVPRLVRIQVNIGAGEGKENQKALDGVVRTLTVITGQKPIITRAKKSISNFKLREGQPVGATVTLRGELMWHFLDKLTSITLPRVPRLPGRKRARV